MKHLRQLVSEWYEYKGYSVYRNIMIGAGVDEKCKELDIIAFNPDTNHMVHLEAWSEADSSDLLEDYFIQKFEAGKKYIPLMFSGLNIPGQIDQIALFLVTCNKFHKEVGGGSVVIISDLYTEIVKSLRLVNAENKEIPEQYYLLRIIQDCLRFEELLFLSGQDGMLSWRYDLLNNQ